VRSAVQLDGPLHALEFVQPPQTLLGGMLADLLASIR